MSPMLYRLTRQWLLVVALPILVSTIIVATGGWSLAWLGRISGSELFNLCELAVAIVFASGPLLLSLRLTGEAEIKSVLLRAMVCKLMNAAALILALIVITLSWLRLSGTQVWSGSLVPGKPGATVLEADPGFAVHLVSGLLVSVAVFGMIEVTRSPLVGSVIEYVMALSAGQRYIRRSGSRGIVLARPMRPHSRTGRAVAWIAASAHRLVALDLALLALVALLFGASAPGAAAGYGLFSLFLGAVLVFLKWALLWVRATELRGSVRGMTTVELILGMLLGTVSVAMVLLWSDENALLPYFLYWGFHVLYLAVAYAWLGQSRWESTLWRLPVMAGLLAQVQARVVEALEEHGSALQETDPALRIRVEEEFEDLDPVAWGGPQVWTSRRNGGFTEPPSARQIFAYFRLPYWS